MIYASYEAQDSCPVREEDEIARYMPIVLQTAASLKRKLPSNVQRDDLIAAGAYALMDSLRRAATTDASAFECYLRIRVRGAMMDELRQQDWLPRRMRCAITQGRGDHGDARVVGIDDTYDELVLADTRTPTPIEHVLAASRSRVLEEAVKKLPARERTVVQLHYFSEVRFKQIGAMLGVSEPRISQLHARALERLREMLDPELQAA
jgi:RNA polymerase sigma factor FliA